MSSTTISRSESEKPTRVVMTVANPYTHDTRIEKEARTLTEYGLDVHVIAFLRAGLARHEVREGVTVHRVRVGGRYLAGLVLLAFVHAERPGLFHRLLPPPAEAKSSVRGGPVIWRLAMLARGLAIVLLLIGLFVRWLFRLARLGQGVRAIRRRMVSARAALPRRSTAQRQIVLARAARNQIALARIAARRRLDPARRRLRPARRRWVLTRVALRRRRRAARRRIVLVRAAARRRLRPARRRVLLTRIRLQRKLRWRVARTWTSAWHRLRAARQRGRTPTAAPARMDSLLNQARRRLSLSGRILNANRYFAQAALALEPDIVHAHDLNTLPCALIVKQLSDTPVIYDSHELFLERNIGSSSRALDRRLWGTIERHGIGHCDAVISVSEAICRTLERQYGLQHVDLLRNVQRYTPPPARRERLFHRAFGLDSQTQIGIYAGGIMRHRGLETIIDCAAHLTDTIFVIMGYAHDAAYLDSLCRRAVELGVLDRTLYFHPAVASADVVHYVAAADIGLVPTENVCLSYFYEASNKIFHCMMAGVPLAMSDHPEKRLLTERYRIGIVFDETQPAASIAERVEGFLGDRESYDSARAACLDAALVLNWEHEEQTLLGIYARLGVEGNGRTAGPPPAIASTDRPTGAAALVPSAPNR